MVAAAGTNEKGERRSLRARRVRLAWLARATLDRCRPRFLTVVLPLRNALGLAEAGFHLKAESIHVVTSSPLERWTDLEVSHAEQAEGAQPHPAT